MRRFDKHPPHQPRTIFAPRRLISNRRRISTVISIFRFTLLHLANSFVSLFGGARIPPGRIKNLQETAQKILRKFSVWP
jgi:hypothetical protein